MCASIKFIILCNILFLQVFVVLSKNVIIIGAGSSGIAAASKLIKNNFTNFKILEAENRIGGRIDTRKLGNRTVDFGAEYVHGQTGNAVYEMVKNLNVLDDGLEIENTEIYYSNGSKINNEIIMTVWKYYDSFQQDVDDRGISVAELYLKNYNRSVLNKYENDLDKTEVAISFIKTAQSLVQSLEGTFNWNQVVVNDDFIDYPGHQDVIWKGVGYKTIIDVLLDSFPNEQNSTTKKIFESNLLLNKKVNLINWNNSKMTEVKCEDGSSYLADYIIFTPSIGVLKKEHTLMFKPNLPQLKSEVINLIGFDAVLKIIVEFPEPYCAGKTDFVFVWSPKDLQDMDKFLVKNSKKKSSWVTDIYSFVKPYGSDNIWIAWYTGEMIPYVETLSNEELREGVLYTLKKFLGKRCKFIQPLSVTQSKWYSNPNFRGSYSYETVDLQKKKLPIRKILQESLTKDGKPRVLFAGEATHPNRFATVDGAIMAGFREADKILSLMENS